MKQLVHPIIYNFASYSRPSKKGQSREIKGRDFTVVIVSRKISVVVNQNNESKLLKSFLVL